MQSLKVGFYGLVSHPGGYGTAARAYVNALHDAGIEVSVVDLSPLGVIRDALVSSLVNRKMVPDFHLFHHFLPETVRPLTLEFDKVIYITTWEADKLRDDWLEVLNHVREVWVPSKHDVSVFSKDITVPVIRWPHPIPPAQMVCQSGSLFSSISEGDFVFYSICVWQPRKNPEGIIEAFLRAFPSKSDVVLVLKTLYRPAGSQDTLCRLREQIRSDAKVIVIDEMWSEEQIEALTQRGNCYISLHRGEGWCYPLFDAVCRGKPVIATGYSGPLDYLDPESHGLVRYSLRGLNGTEGWYRSPMHWAEPDLEHAAHLMRQVHTYREEISAKTRRAARDLSKRYSSQVIGSLARDRLLLLL